MSAGTCRSCGCTDERACSGGCYWVEPDLCSQCAAAIMVAETVGDFMGWPVITRQNLAEFIERA